MKRFVLLLYIVTGGHMLYAQSKRPNIVFIMTDDHTIQAMSAYGSKLVKTPNLDRIANEGMLFNNCFVTNAVCGPSRATILTGKYSHLNGLTDNSKMFDSTQVIYPQLLKQAGYQTAMIGKWHLGSTPMGFDYYSILPNQGQYYQPEFLENGKLVKERGYVTDIITDKAIDFLEKRDHDKPFMMIYQHKAPHRNWLPAPRHLGMLIHFYNDVDEWELYDMQKDPKEMKNLYADKTYQPVIKALKAQLKKLQEQYKDTNPTETITK